MDAFLWIIIALSIFLPICAAQAQETDQALQAFMGEHYGHYDADKQLWHRAQDDSLPNNQGMAGTFKVCARASLSTSAGPRFMVAACGKPDTFSHSEPGFADFYILKPDSNGVLKVVEFLIGEGGGSDGDPGTITIQRFGPHLFGFAEHDGSVYQGYAVNVQHFYIPWKGKIVPSRGIDVTMENDGAVGCAEHPDKCDDLHFDMQVDDLGSNIDVYPLIVEEHGIQHGKRVAHTYRVLFDPLKGEYVIPKELEQGY